MIIIFHLLLILLMTQIKNNPGTWANACLRQHQFDLSGNNHSLFVLEGGVSESIYTNKPRTSFVLKHLCEEELGIELLKSGKIKEGDKGYDTLLKGLVERYGR